MKTRKIGRAGGTRWWGVALMFFSLTLAACGPDLAGLDGTSGLYFNALIMTGPGNGYAVGLQLGQSRGVLLRATNGAWGVDPAQPPVAKGDTLKAVAVVGATLWVAGSNTDASHGNATQTTGFIAHRSGTGTWEREKFGASINALAFSTADDGWAVGNGGLIVHFQGGSWSAVPDAMSDTLLALAFRTPTDGWAVGEMGALVHYNGTNWVHAPSITHETITSLALSAADGWAAGTNGSLFRLDGTRWNGFTAPINVSNFAITLVQGDVWVVGDHGSVYQRPADTGAWRHFAPPADLRLNAVAVDPAGTLWTGGNATQPTLYALKNDAWQTITIALPA